MSTPRLLPAVTTTRSEARAEFGRKFSEGAIAALNQARERAAKDPIDQALKAIINRHRPKPRA